MIKEVYKKVAQIKSNRIKRLILKVARVGIIFFSKLFRFQPPEKVSLMSYEMLFGTWDLQVKNYLKKTLNPGDIVVDVGAHVGYFSIVSSRLVGEEGKVYAFEPEPENFAKLLKNSQKYKNIVPVNKAVSDSKGSLDFFVSDVGSGRHSLVKERGSFSECLKVSVTTLNAFLEREGVKLDDLRLVKIDIEGAELGALRGMDSIIQDEEAPDIIIEFYPEVYRKQKINPVELLKFLDLYKYKVFLLSDDGDTKLISPNRFTSFVEHVDKYVNLIAKK